MPQVIAVHGFARSGKDTIAGFLKEAGYERLAFADALRDVIYRLNPQIEVGFQTTDRYGNPSEIIEHFRLQQIIDTDGWEMAKSAIPEIRRLMQVMGTEAGRNILGTDIWVDVVMRQIKENPDKKYVITDLRFHNELAALDQYGPDVLFVKVKRPGVGPINDHPSDAGLADTEFDVILENDGSLEELRDKTLVLGDQGQLTLW